MKVVLDAYCSTCGSKPGTNCIGNIVHASRRERFEDWKDGELKKVFVLPTSEHVEALDNLPRPHVTGVYPPSEIDSRVDARYIDEVSAISLNTEQAPPIPNDSPAIWDLVVADMHERNRDGTKKYGTPLQAGNGRDALVDAYQESLDQTVYLRKEIEERKNHSYCAIDLTTFRVTEFHQKFNQPIHTTPWVPDRDRVLLRLSLMIEEFFETLRACIDDRSGISISMLARAKAATEGAVRTAALFINLSDFADGLTDQDIINEGTRLEFGIQREGIEALVHAANMRKEGGGLREDGKILKPAGWIAPDIAGELRRQGWLG